MRQVLFQIPLDRPWNLGPLGNVPGFGFGLVLAIWVIFGASALYMRGRETRWKFKATDEIAGGLKWLAVAAFIVFGAPALGAYLRQNGTEHFREGLPIFGYGLMMLIGFIAAIGLAS